MTLELGGKSPVIVDPSADIDEVATKVLWGKTVNAGQSCVAPDYVLVPKNLEARFIELARDSLEKRFGSLDRLAENPDFGRIINKGHFQRIKHLVDDAIEGGARIEMGGRFREDNRFISPTVLTHVPPAAAVLQEEIFGPVLPIVTYESREDALRFVNERPTPLALYVFGKSKPAVEAILKETGAGGNDGERRRRPLRQSLFTVRRTEREWDRESTRGFRVQSLFERKASHAPTQMDTDAASLSSLHPQLIGLTIRYL